MGGKSDSSPPPPPPQAPPPDPSANIDAMLGMLDGMMQQFAAAQEEMFAQMSEASKPILPPRPEFDFDEQRSAINKKMKNDAARSARLRLGRRSTFLTSPLIEDEVPSILAPTPGAA